MTKDEVLALVAAIAAVNGHPAPAEYAEAVAAHMEAKAKEAKAEKKEKK